MIGKHKVIHLLGSTSGNEKRFRDMETLLTEKGYIVFAPVCYNKCEYIKRRRMYDSMCYSKLTACDACVLVTPERIGESTATRLLQARKLRKPVYVVMAGTLLEFIY